MKLRLGVIQLPYGTASSVTTGDVAGFLEAKYGVMQRFWTLNEQQFGEDLAESYAGHLENVMAGASGRGNPFRQALSQIEAQWKLFITHEDITETGAPGVPTKVALEGISKRFKRGRGSARRVSFYDTGLYLASFKAWIDR